MKKTWIGITALFCLFGICACHNLDEPIALHSGKAYMQDEITIIEKISEGYVVAEEIKEGGGEPCLFHKFDDGQYEMVAVLGSYAGLFFEDNSVYVVLFNRICKYNLSLKESYPLEPEITELFPRSSKLQIARLAAYDEKYLYVNAYRDELNPEHRYYRVNRNGSEYIEINKQEIPNVRK